MKCPCKNCITLSMCKNIGSDKYLTVLFAKQKCSILEQYLDIPVVCKIPLSLNYNLKSFRFVRRFNITTRILMSKEKM